MMDTLVRTFSIPVLRALVFRRHSCNKKISLFSQSGKPGSHAVSYVYDMVALAKENVYFQK